MDLTRDLNGARAAQRGGLRPSGFTPHEQTRHIRRLQGPFPVDFCTSGSSGEQTLQLLGVRQLVSSDVLIPRESTRNHEARVVDPGFSVVASEPYGAI
jgi:hypothetical protein